MHHRDDDANLYGVLEVDPGATEDEIRRAYKRLSTLFDPNSMVVYGLYRLAEAQRLGERLRLAYETLVDPEKRRGYDRQLYPQGHPSLRRADQRVASAPPTPRPDAPADPLAALGLVDDTPLTGEVLARVRQVCHVTLEEIADRTKIPMFTLRCIEGDQFSDLPAPVYLKGFLKQIAGMLNLSPDQLVADYMGAYSAWEIESARNKRWG
jgi:flagellar biosynthesis protein FlhG